MSDIDTHGSEFGDLDETQIRDLAHRLWHEDGEPEGRSDEYWYRAQQMLAGAAAAEASPEADHEHPAEQAQPSFIETAPVG